jgi:hypothetical protein
VVLSGSRSYKCLCFVIDTYLKLFYIAASIDCCSFKNVDGLSDGGLGRKLILPLDPDG